MDKSLKSFAYASALIMIFFFLIITFFSFIYKYSTINTYSNILLIAILMIIIISLVFIFVGITVFYAYKKKYVYSLLSLPVKLGLRVLLPLVILLSGLFKFNKDFIRKFYVEVNNIWVQSKGKKYTANQVFMLLPHCLQNSDCGYKVTNTIDNCKRCGKCCIGDIAGIIDETGISAAVVTGGTSARNIIEKNRPSVVLSVACERDLTSGIADVVKIPVIGIVNERPNGPCNNTLVDVAVLRQNVDNILKSEIKSS